MATPRDRTATHARLRACGVRGARRTHVARHVRRRRARLLSSVGLSIGRALHGEGALSYEASLIQPTRRSLFASTSAALRNEDSASARYSTASRRPSFVGAFTSTPARVSCCLTIGIAASWP